MNSEQGPIKKESAQESVCPICYEARQKGDAGTTILQCGHLFCCLCIDTWKASGHYNCPSCRQAIPTPLLNTPMMGAPAAATFIGSGSRGAIFATRSNTDFSQNGRGVGNLSVNGRVGTSTSPAVVLSDLSVNGRVGTRGLATNVTRLPAAETKESPLRNAPRLPIYRTVEDADSQSPLNKSCEFFVVNKQAVDRYQEEGCESVRCTADVRHCRFCQEFHDLTLEQFGQPRWYIYERVGREFRLYATSPCCIFMLQAGVTRAVSRSCYTVSTRPSFDLGGGANQISMSSSIYYCWIDRRYHSRRAEDLALYVYSMHTEAWSSVNPECTCTV